MCIRDRASTVVALAEQQNLGKIKGLAVAADGAVYLAYTFDGTIERFDPSSGDSEIITAGPRPGGWTWSGALLFDESGELWAGMGDTGRRLAGGQWSVLPLSLIHLPQPTRPD